MDSITTFYDLGIQEIIKNSSEVSILLKNSLDLEYLDEDMEQEVFSNIKSYLDIIQSVEFNDEKYKLKYNTEQFNSKWMEELKSFLILLFKSLIEKSFKLLKLNNEFQDQKEKWQSTLDKIIESHEEEMNNSKLD